MRISLLQAIFIPDREMPRRRMKRVAYLLMLLLYSVCNANTVTFVAPEASLNPIVSDLRTNTSNQVGNSAHTIHISNSVTFSTQHRFCRHHTAAPQYDLNRMNTEQLARYFATQNYTEVDILSHPMLYMNPAYLALVKQLPRYPEFVKKYYEGYRKHKGFRAFWAWIHFRYRYGMREQFAFLYQECEKERIVQEARERMHRAEKAQKEREVRVLQEAADAYRAKIESIAQDASPDEYQQSREKAYQQIKIRGIDRATHQYTVDRDVITFAHEYDIAESDLTMLHGNAYEQQLHAEFLEQLTAMNTISAYYAHQSKNILIDAVGHGAAIGMEANRLQQPDVATAWANFGWKVLDVIKGFGEGLLLFADNTVDMILHPQDTLMNVVHGIGFLIKSSAQTIAVSMGAAIKLNVLKELGDYDAYAEEVEHISKNIKTVQVVCTEQLAALSLKDTVKYSTACAADIMLSKKIFAFGSIICTRASPIIRNAFAHISERLVRMRNRMAQAIEAARAESPIVQTAEGLYLKASEGLNNIGGAAPEILSGIRLALEAVHADYMAHLEADLKIIRLLFDNKVKGFAECANKFLKIEYKHVLGIEHMIWNRKGFLDNLKGFHHDFMSTFKKSGVFDFIDQVMYEHGFYRASVLHEGNIVKRAGTFFPDTWPREKVIEKIYEAYDNFLRSGAKDFIKKDGKYCIKGLIAEGFEIEMWITQKGKVATAYPILP